MNEAEPEKPQWPKPPTLHLITPFVIAGVCAALFVWSVYARPRFWGLTLGGTPLDALLIGIAGAILVFTLPVCILILLGHPPVMTLSPFFPSREQRAKWAEMRQRPGLSDDEFYERFYAGTGIAREIPLRLRRVYDGALGTDRVWPADKAHEFDDDLDLADLFFVVEKEFKVKVNKEEALKLDHSFDSIVRLVASKLDSPPTESSGRNASL
jgi:acyl carrier protein